MKIIDSKTHGVLDYLTAVLFIASPWIFGFHDIEAAMWSPVVIGILVIVMSFLTNYELGIYPAIPFTIHLTMDVLAGLFLMASPWVFGFEEAVMWPHVVFGITAVAISLMTRLTVQDPQLLEQ